MTYPFSRRWRWFLPGYVLALPNTVIGLVLSLFYGAHHWRWSDGCLEATCKRIIGNPGAQTHGFVIFYSHNEFRARPGLRVHERVHVVQGMLGGPLFVLAYGLHFLWLWAWSGFGPWWPAYKRICFERQAYRIQDEFIAEVSDRRRSLYWGAL